MKNRPFPAVDAGRIEIVPISEEKGEIIKVTNEIGENIPASKLIEDFFYVQNHPLPDELDPDPEEELVCAKANVLRLLVPIP